MKTIFPVHIYIAFLLLIIQAYLLVYVTLFILQRLKLLKQPYGGMDYPELLPAVAILTCVLLISSANASAIFQAVKTYRDGNTSPGESSFLVLARSFLIILFVCLLFIVLNFLNIRFLFRGYYQAPTLPVSILLCAITTGIALTCWIVCKEITDNMTPRFINY